MENPHFTVCFAFKTSPDFAFVRQHTVPFSSQQKVRCSNGRLFESTPPNEVPPVMTMDILVERSRRFDCRLLRFKMQK
jgi:hypothetical protein